MFILKIISQSRRDFIAIYKCEHCNHEFQGSGYDDTFFHETVVPNKECSKCNKKADKKIFKALRPKYPKDCII